MKTCEMAEGVPLDDGHAGGAVRLTVGHILLGLIVVSALGWVAIAGLVHIVMQLFG